MLDHTIAVIPGATRRRLDVDGLHLHALDYLMESGSTPHDHAPRILLLHGGMAHARWWDLVASRLVAWARVYALDRRGHGDSDWAHPESYGWERDLLDAEAAMDLLDDGPWVLIGHSQGGLQAVPLALRKRVQTAALVLVDVPLRPSSPRLMKAGRSFTKIRQARYPSLEEAIESFRPFPSPHHIATPALRYIATHSFKPTEDGAFTTKFDWQVFRRNHGSAENPLADFAEQLAALEIPVLSLRGAESTILTPADQERLLAKLRQGSGAVIPRSTHNLHAEAPDAVAQAIGGFLGSL